MTDVLARVGAASNMLAEAKTLDDMKHIMDIAEAARTYAKAAKMGLVAQNHAAELKLRAERKAGELLATLERSKGGRPETQTSVVRVSEYRSVLQETQTAPTTAHRWQTIAAVPTQVFERVVIEAQVQSTELTSAQMLRVAKDIERAVHQSMTAQAGATKPAQTERYRLFVSPVMAALEHIEKDSIDAIVTDPPYPAEYLRVYSELARVAGLVLKPGGSLFVMTGQTHLPQVFERLCAHPFMAYQWTFAYMTPGGQAPQIFPRRVNTFWKPVLWLVKAPGYTGKWVGDVSRSATNDNDKRYHHWGQSFSGMVDLVERVTEPASTVYDPFCGGGATGAACLVTDRFFIGSDSDEQAINISRARLAEVSDAEV